MKFNSENLIVLHKGTEKRPYRGFLFYNLDLQEMTTATKAKKSTSSIDKMWILNGLKIRSDDNFFNFMTLS